MKFKEVILTKGFCSSIFIFLGSGILAAIARGLGWNMKLLFVLWVIFFISLGIMILMLIIGLVGSERLIRDLQNRTGKGKE